MIKWIKSLFEKELHLENDGWWYRGKSRVKKHFVRARGLRVWSKKVNDVKYLYNLHKTIKEHKNYHYLNHDVMLLLGDALDKIVPDVNVVSRIRVESKIIYYIKYDDKRLIITADMLLHEISL